MKKLIYILTFLFVSTAFLGACTKVEPGYQAVKVHLGGDDKGEPEVLPNGRYIRLFNFWKTDFYKYPTFEQNYVFTSDEREGSEDDESFTFQTSGGVEVTANVGISYMVEDVGVAFYRYRKGIDEITNTFIRNMIRDGFNRHASSMGIDSLYSDGKVTLMDSVFTHVAKEAKEAGINVIRVYLIGTFEFPNSIKQAINLKITADQSATTRELQRREAIAQAEIEREKAEGKADAMLIEAKAEAEANRLKLQSLSKLFVEYQAVQKWNGQLPTYAGGGAVPFLNIE